MLHFLGFSEHRLRHCATLMGAGLVLALASFWPLQASALHTSALCQAQKGTVTAGGTVTIEISACQEVSGSGELGPIDGGSHRPADTASHGTAATRFGSDSSKWFLDYSHGGSGGIGFTDVFELSDGAMSGIGDIQFTIHINLSASLITMTPGTLPAFTFRGTSSCS